MVASPQRPVRVVVVDDSVDVRALVSFGLSCAGMDVVGEAGDGCEGVEVVREERPDVVLLDLAMPIMDGVEALPLIRDLVPDAQIIVFSAFDISLTDRVLHSGADGHVVKGTSLREIVAYVEGKLAGRSETSDVGRF
jgi:DNA-binding NarL/FixJ family response regulator